MASHLGVRVARFGALIGQLVAEPLVRAFFMVMGGELAQEFPQVPEAKGMTFDKHSRRVEPMSRSLGAALGA